MFLQAMMELQAFLYYLNETSFSFGISDISGQLIVYPQARPDPSDGNSFNSISKVPGMNSFFLVH